LSQMDEVEEERLRRWKEMLARGEDDDELDFGDKVKVSVKAPTVPHDDRMREENYLLQEKLRLAEREVAKLSAIAEAAAEEMKDAKLVELAKKVIQLLQPPPPTPQNRTLTVALEKEKTKSSRLTADVATLTRQLEVRTAPEVKSDDGAAAKIKELSDKSAALSSKLSDSVRTPPPGS
jgi:hypothetical protein